MRDIKCLASSLCCWSPSTDCKFRTWGGLQPVRKWWQHLTQSLCTTSNKHLKGSMQSHNPETLPQSPVNLHPPASNLASPTGQWDQHRSFTTPCFKTQDSGLYSHTTWRWGVWTIQAIQHCTLLTLYQTVNAWSTTVHSKCLEGEECRLRAGWDQRGPKPDCAIEMLVLLWVIGSAWSAMPQFPQNWRTEGQTKEATSNRRFTQQH